jgi:hypothetical protein
MAAKKFIVELNDQERARLYAVISKGKASAKVMLKVCRKCLTVRSFRQIFLS